MIIKDKSELYSKLMLESKYNRIVMDNYNNTDI